jgi:uncharacterized YigZ family protein
MDVFSYQTILASTEGLYREKGSKFLAFAFPVANEEEIRARLDHLRKQFFDARHHCYAWILGADKSRFRAYDDGEPNHSAGDPILGQIRSRNLSNVLVVVVRYFGGVKLGVGGLVSAYKAAAYDALQKATVIEIEVRVPLRLKFAYDATPDIMRLVKNCELNIVEQQFGESCLMHAEVPQRMLKGFQENILLLQAMKVKVEMSVL